MTNATVPAWETKRTAETRSVEEALRNAGFHQVDAYRYNSASIRVRVIDPQFEGLPVDHRDALVERHLEKLPENIQRDIMSLFAFSPKEIAQQSPARVTLLNLEFEDPSPSML